MAKTIRTADFEEVLHDKCGKPIARIINGILHVQCLRKGCREWVPISGWVQGDKILGVLELILSGQISPAEVLALSDPLIAYRQIEGLIVIGPTDIERAFLGPNGENPLNLVPGWCPRDIPMVYKTAKGEEIEITPTLMVDLVQLCQTLEWDTTPILQLVLPEVAGQLTSLTNQYGWWGVHHDDLPAGKIRSNIQWSNWFIKSQYDWALEPASSDPTWMIGYELSHWTTGLSWDDQQKAAHDRGMSIATACRDALMCNLVAITARRKLRTTTWSRTTTICGGRPAPCPLGSRPRTPRRSELGSSGCQRRCRCFCRGSSFGAWFLGSFGPSGLLASGSYTLDPFGAEFIVTCSRSSSVSFFVFILI